MDVNLQNYEPKQACFLQKLIVIVMECWLMQNELLILLASVHRLDLYNLM